MINSVELGKAQTEAGRSETASKQDIVDALPGINCLRLVIIPSREKERGGVERSTKDDSDLPADRSRFSSIRVVQHPRKCGVPLGELVSKTVVSSLAKL